MATDLITLRHRPADTPLREFFLIAGAKGSIHTDSELIMAAARESFVPLSRAPIKRDFSMRFFVDKFASCTPSPHRFYFAGLRHLIFFGFDEKSSLLIDLRRRRVMGRFSPQLAADRRYWKNAIFPGVVGTLGPSLGIAPLHCACVVRNGKGLLLAGESGAGKSTLSLALARIGFDFLSDDWTYFSTRDGRVNVWGMATMAKLLPGMRRFFPEVAALPLTVAFNGERSYEIDPERIFGAKRCLQCEPGCVVFLARQPRSPFQLRSISAERAAARLEDELRPDEPEDAEPRRAAARALSAGPCFELRYGNRPERVAEALANQVKDCFEV